MWRNKVHPGTGEVLAASYNEAKPDPTYVAHACGPTIGVKQRHRLEERRRSCISPAVSKNAHKTIDVRSGLVYRQSEPHMLTKEQSGGPSYVLTYEKFWLSSDRGPSNPARAVEAHRKESCAIQVEGNNGHRNLCCVSLRIRSLKSLDFGVDTCRICMSVSIRALRLEADAATKREPAQSGIAVREYTH